MWSEATLPRWLVLLLLLAGVAMWAGCELHQKPIDRQWIDLPTVCVAVLAIISVCFSAGRAWLTRGYEWIERATGKQPLTTAMIITFIAAGYLLLTAALQDRDWFPKWHDEFMYLIQAQMLARGHLLMPPHPLGEFFESFYLLTSPVYAAERFPGASLLYVPAVWFGWPHWVIPLSLAAICVGAIYLFVKELLGSSVAGLLAALLLIGCKIFRFESLMTMANLPAMLGGLLLLIVQQRWRRSMNIRWTAVLGFIGAWLLVTRPADAMCVIIPVAIVCVIQLRGQPPKRITLIAITLLVAAAPFLTLQLALNRSITGTWLTPPFNYYNARYYPQVTIGLPTYDPAIHPQTNILQKRLMYDDWVVPFVKNHQWHNFLQTLIGTRVPTALLDCSAVAVFLVLLPVGIAALIRKRRWQPVAIIGGFFVVYGLYTIYLNTYCLLITPMVIVALIAGVSAISETFWFCGATAIALSLFLISGVLLHLPETSKVFDDTTFMPVMTANMNLPGHIEEPAVVLFKFVKGDNLHEEPVYNFDVMWPDDAPIIRAHDLGDQKDQEIYAYYAARQPNRIFYRLNRGDGSFTRLGSARALAEHRATSYSAALPDFNVPPWANLPGVTPNE